MIKFDDLHQSISKKIYVPFIGDIMVTRWAYEALCVEQFKTNSFEKPFFYYDMTVSQNDWNASFLVPALKLKVDNCLAADKNPDFKMVVEADLKKISFHIKNLSNMSGIQPGSWIRNLNYHDFNDTVAKDTKKMLDSLKGSFRAHSRLITFKRDSLFKILESNAGEDRFVALRTANYNENLANYVLNRLATNKIYDADDRLIQKADPIFMPPGSKFGRAHFFAPFKQIGSLKIETLLFNMMAVWFMIGVLFVTLYYNVLKRFIRFLESLKLPILRKFGRDLLQV
jgi:ABC transport system ATP-binding/permease protein